MPIFFLFWWAEVLCFWYKFSILALWLTMMVAQCRLVSHQIEAFRLALRDWILLFCVPQPESARDSLYSA